MNTDKINVTVSFKQLDRSNKIITLSFLGLMLNGTLENLFKIIEIPGAIEASNIISIFFYLLGLLELFKKETGLIIYSYFIFGGIWALSYFFFPNNVPYLNDELIQFFFGHMPFLFFGYYFIKENFGLSIFLPIARIQLILAIIVQLLIFLFGSSYDVYNGNYQVAAYALMCGLISTYYLSLKEKNYLDIFLSIIGTILLIIVGSRAVFVALVFFWVMYFFMNKSVSANITVFLIIILFFTVIDIQSLLRPLRQLATSLNISTHLVDALLSGGIFEDDSRVDLFAGFWDLAKEKPFGYGVMGDRYISFQTGLFRKPIYPHNIFMEILVQFGYLGGSVLIIWFLNRFIHGLFLNDSVSYRMAVLIISSVSLIKLMFASSFWMDRMFFMLLGILLASKHTVVQENDDQSDI